VGVATYARAHLDDAVTCDDVNLMHRDRLLESGRHWDMWSSSWQGRGVALHVLKELPMDAHPNGAASRSVRHMRHDAVSRLCCHGESPQRVLAMHAPSTRDRERSERFG
jgi:hypothetical protein